MKCILCKSTNSKQVSYNNEEEGKKITTIYRCLNCNGKTTFIAEADDKEGEKE